MEIIFNNKKYRIIKKNDCKDKTLLSGYNFEWQYKNKWLKLKNVQYMYNILRYLKIIN